MSDLESSGYEGIFGSQNYKQGGDGQSVLSPTAYLLDLINVMFSTISQPSDPILAIQKRRPDIFDSENGMLLSNDNATTEVSYLVIIISVVTKNILSLWNDQNGNPSNQPDVLADLVRTAIYPANLPFNAATEQFYQCLQNTDVEPQNLRLAYSSMLANYSNNDLLLNIAMDYFGLSPDQTYQLFANPFVFNQSTVNPLYGFTPDPDAGNNKVGVLKLVNELLVLARITSDDLYTLITRNLSQDELLVGYAPSQFYINNISTQTSPNYQYLTLMTDPNENALVLGVASTDGTAPPANTTLDDPANAANAYTYLGRIAQFTRIAAAINWDYADLDLVISTLGEGTIATWLLPRLAAIDSLSKSLNLPVDAVVGCIGPINQIGQGTNYSSTNPNMEYQAQDLFDRIFNNALQEFDDNQPIQSYTGIASNPPVLPYKRLTAAFQISQADLTLIATALNNYWDSTVNTTIVNRLSQIYRFAILPKKLGLSVTDCINLLNLMNTFLTNPATWANGLNGLYNPFQILTNYFDLNNLTITAIETLAGVDPTLGLIPLQLQLLQLLQATVQWMNAEGLSVSQLVYLCLNRNAQPLPAGSVSNDLTADQMTTLYQNLQNQFQTIAITPNNLIASASTIDNTTGQRVAITSELAATILQSPGISNYILQLPNTTNVSSGMVIALYPSIYPLTISSLSPAQLSLLQSVLSTLTVSVNNQQIAIFSQAMAQAFNTSADIILALIGPVYQSIVLPTPSISVNLIDVITFFMTPVQTLTPSQLLANSSLTQFLNRLSQAVYLVNTLGLSADQAQAALNNLSLNVTNKFYQDSQLLASYSLSLVNIYGLTQYRDFAAKYNNASQISSAGGVTQTVQLEDYLFSVSPTQQYNLNNVLTNSAPGANPPTLNLTPYPGQSMGSATYIVDRFGNPNSALQINNAFSAITTNPSGGTPTTIGLWVPIVTNSPTTNNVFAIALSGGNYVQITVQQTSANSPTASLQLGYNNLNLSSQSINASSSGNGSWAHLAFVINPMAGAKSPLLIYINGVDSTANFNPTLLAIINTALSGNNTWTASIAGQFFNGLISITLTVDNISIFNQVLSSDAVQRLYQLQQINAYTPDPYAMLAQVTKWSYNDITTGSGLTSLGAPFTTKPQSIDQLALLVNGFNIAGALQLTPATFISEVWNNVKNPAPDAPWNPASPTPPANYTNYQQANSAIFAAIRAGLSDVEWSSKLPQLTGNLNKSIRDAIVPYLITLYQNYNVLNGYAPEIPDLSQYYDFNDNNNNNAPSGVPENILFPKSQIFPSNPTNVNYSVSYIPDRFDNPTGACQIINGYSAITSNPFPAKAFTVAFWTYAGAIDSQDAFLNQFGQVGLYEMISGNPDSISYVAFNISPIISGIQPEEPLLVVLSKINVPITPNYTQLALPNPPSGNGQWLHFAITVDPTDTTPIAVYCNGVVVPNPFGSNEAVINNWIQNANWTVMLGPPASNQNNQLYTLDDLCIFDRALTQQEIATLYTAQIPPAPVNYPYGWIQDTRDLYQILLLDTQMNEDANTSLISDAVTTIQNYIERVRMGLEPQVEVLSPKLEVVWPWMQSFSTWVPNRQMFLYPESYLDPSLRTSMSSAFAVFQKQLIQSNISTDLVTTLYNNYLKAFADTANLNIVGCCVYEDPILSQRVLVTIGQTKTSPTKYYYRSSTFYATEFGPYDVEWNYWQEINIKINADAVTPVFAYGRLYLFWSEQQQVTNTTVDTGGASVTVTPSITAILYVATYDANGVWESPRKLLGNNSAALTISGGPDAPTPVLQSFTQVDVIYDGNVIYIGYGVNNTSTTPPYVNQYNWGYIFLSDYSISPITPTEGSTYSLQIQTTLLTQSSLPSIDDVGPVFTNPTSVTYEQLPVYNQPDWYLLNYGINGTYLIVPNISMGMVNNLVYSSVNGDKQVILASNIPYSNVYIQASNIQFDILRLTSNAAPQLIEILNSGGLDALLSTTSQQINEASPFVPNTVSYTITNEVTYVPNFVFTVPSTQHLDFIGADSPYYWEIFYHAPFLIADQLNQSQQYQEAIEWFNYIYNPAASNYWNFFAFQIYPYTESSMINTLVDKIQTVVQLPAPDGDGVLAPTGNFTFSAIPFVGFYPNLNYANGGYLDCGSNAILDISESFTFECWVSADLGTTETMYLITRGGSIDYRMNGYSLYLQSNSSGAVILCLELVSIDPLLPENEPVPTGQGVKIFSEAIPGWTNNTWQYLAVTWNYSNFGEVSFYYGNSSSANPLDLDPTSPTNFQSLLTVANQPLRIGQQVKQDGTVVGGFTGQIAEVRIWNNAVSGTNIINNYNAPLTGTNPNLIGYWPLNEGSSPDTILNLAALNFGLNLNAYFHFPAWNNNTSPVCSSILAMDSSHRIDCSFSELSFSIGITGELWVQIPETTEDAMFMECLNNMSNQYGFSLFLTTDNSNNLCIFANLYLEGGSNITLSYQISTGVYFKFNEWNHLAFSAQQDGYFNLYINGSLAATPVSLAGIILPEAYDVSFAGGVNYVTEVQLWNRELSIDEIQYTMFQNPQSAVPYLVGYWPLHSIIEGSTPQTVQNVVPYLPVYGGAENNDYDAQIEAYETQPFEPYAIANLRQITYQKAIVANYISNLLNWGDNLFTQNTRETISEALNIYMLAYQLLGKTPQVIGNVTLQTAENVATLTSPTYTMDGLIVVETDVIGTTLPAGEVQLDILSPLYFTIQPDQNLLALWSTVNDRITKIQNSESITGVFEDLPLFPAPLNPMALVSAQAAGGFASFLSLSQIPLPNYRFVSVIQETKEVLGQVMQFGASLLSALEKGDAENLQLLQITQEGALLNMNIQVRTNEINQIQNTINSLNASLQNVNLQISTYSNWLSAGLIAAESQALDSLNDSIQDLTTSQITAIEAAASQLIPQLGSPFAMTFGGLDIGPSITTLSQAFATQSQIDSSNSNYGSLNAGYLRRVQEWTLQWQMAQNSVNEIQNQINGAEVQLNTAQINLSILQTQIAQNQAINSFLVNKFSNVQLYSYLAGQLSNLYSQMFQLAQDLAFIAQMAYQFELASTDTFIGTNYWNGQYKGLLAGEALMNDVLRMEKAYRDNNIRRFEVRKTISLQDYAPDQLIKLRTNGSCSFSLSEALFDADYPNHYCRQIKSISISIPAVLGPYQQFHATLSQSGNKLLMTADPSMIPYMRNDTGATGPNANVRLDWRANQQIAISSGLNDAGLFELRFDDERFLPFEGTGAVSDWNFALPVSNNPIDYSAISDVIIDVAYTALSTTTQSFINATGGLTSTNSNPGALSNYNGVAYLSMAELNPVDWNAFLNMSTSSRQIEFDCSSFFRQLYSTTAAANQIISITAYIALSATPSSSWPNFLNGVTLTIPANSALDFAASNPLNQTPPGVPYASGLLNIGSNNISYSQSGLSSWVLADPSASLTSALNVVDVILVVEYTGTVMGYSAS